MGNWQTDASSGLGNEGGDKTTNNNLVELLRRTESKQPVKFAKDVTWGKERLPIAAVVFWAAAGVVGVCGGRGGML